jgi:cation transport regulator
VRRHLPAVAQDIYRETFNHAWRTYAAWPDRERIAHRIAWTAVKRKFEKIGDFWYRSVS